MSKPSLTLRNVTFMTPDPTSLAAFWSGALGYSQRRDGEKEVLIADDDWGCPRFTFQRVETARAGDWQPVHVDLTAEDRPAEVQRLVALGATEVRTHGDGAVTWTVMLDPDGNEFCVAQIRD
jgi:catechol 2,3-dioxygenase-like lactoylglutathione lyase family enzyme